MKVLKDGFFLLVGAGVIIWSFYMFLQQPAPMHYQEFSTVRVGEHEILVEVADTDQEKALGLSGREELPRGYGMLFLFEESAIYSFWMRGMNFSIDIVWIDENRQVISIDRSVSPETFPELFSPASPARYVLELPAGDAEAFGIEVGTTLSFE